jgi:hypothetical protein
MIETFVCSIAGREESPYLRTEYCLLDSSIHTLMLVVEARESYGVQSRHCSLGKCTYYGGVKQDIFGTIL